MRWAVGARAASCRNLTKNFFAHLRYNPLLAIAAALRAAVAASRAVAGNRACNGMGARRICDSARLSSHRIHRYGKAHEDQSSAMCCCIPWRASLMVFTLLRSTVLTLAHGGVEWRGTFYPLAELKKNR